MSAVDSKIPHLFEVSGFAKVEGGESKLVLRRIAAGADAQEAKEAGAAETRSAALALHLVVHGEPTGEAVSVAIELIIIDHGPFPYSKYYGPSDAEPGALS